MARDPRLRVRGVLRGKELPRPGAGGSIEPGDHRGLAFLAAGIAKVRRQEPVTGTLAGLGVSPSLQRTIGILEVLGGLGVVIGLLVQPLGILAAVGLALMMAGALAYHAKARDVFKNSAGALVLLVFAAVVTTLQIVTA